ncbi:DNA ligase, partial [Candidatus Bathyarchaeota archaeon]|nr:DNA ligase [Candidatus Bathyarchaeota archaeon]
MDVYEKIEATTKRIEMRDLLAELFKKTPKDTVEMAVYLTQGKLYPDYVGIELGMADKLIIRAIALASGKDEKTVESIYKTTGDLGEAVEKLLTKKMQQTLTKTPLTVEDVYRSFDKIARSSGPGSVEAKVKLLCSLLNDATPKEAKYIVRMALGRLRLGVADMTILEGLSIAYLGDVEGKRYLERAYNLSSDLGLIARTVAQSGLDGILNLKVKVGRPIRP